MKKCIPRIPLGATISGDCREGISALFGRRSRNDKLAFSQICRGVRLGGLRHGVEQVAQLTLRHPLEESTASIDRRARPRLSWRTKRRAYLGNRLPREAEQAHNIIPKVFPDAFRRGIAGIAVDNRLNEEEKLEGNCHRIWYSVNSF